ncbi:PIN domain-containing protein [candidate division KSB3 bacterium]|uniref:PIN domain-containing protein n=1 Tax=candidate division KSB3 bacterium TaxID=2044937 RepID=A0A9D5Q6J7_9BACT|nr:PIN domain-containing protein [candidate division KSB3 bacterium]MBD3325317.1 PIN domain-containing protein [candidate division KSB3 bacterium]
MLLLDTDTLTHLHAGHPNVIAHLHQADDPDIGITVITKIELLRGRFDFVLKAATGRELLRAQYWLHRTEELLAQILIFPINTEAVAHFDRLRTMKQLRKIGRADMLIASIALSHQATLVTRNRRHFQHVPELSVTNWVD